MTDIWRSFIAPRVNGQVTKVLVEDNNRVKKGDLIVQLDPEPYQAIVNIKASALASAKSDLEAARANVRGLEAEARSKRWKLQHAIEDVNNQIALLKSNIAALEAAKAVATRASSDLQRALPWAAGLRTITPGDGAFTSIFPSE
jgi:membrane fusion protein (multidrug efflux system)